MPRARNTAASLIVGAFHTAGQSGSLNAKPYPLAEQLEKIATKDAGDILNETEAAIKRATNAAVVRWAPPNVMLTMDYRADRATAWLGPDNKITKVRCG